MMADALKKAGKTYDYVELTGAGHGGWDTKTLTKVLERSTTFIASHLG